MSAKSLLVDRRAVKSNFFKLRSIIHGCYHPAKIYLEKCFLEW